MAKRANLSDFAAKKPSAEEPVAPPPLPAPNAAGRGPSEASKLRAQTLRLNPAAWRQLKQLALDHGTPAHDLLLEAVNDLFRKNGKPPIA